MTYRLTPKKERSKKAHNVGQFLASSLLGIITPITYTPYGSGPGQPAFVEQRLWIRAMEEMIKVCKAHVRTARPQVSQPNTIVRIFFFFFGS